MSIVLGKNWLLSTLWKKLRNKLGQIKVNEAENFLFNLQIKIDKIDIHTQFKDFIEAIKIELSLVQNEIVELDFKMLFES